MDKHPSRRAPAMQMFYLKLPASSGITKWESCLSLNEHILKVLVGENKQE